MSIVSSTPVKKSSLRFGLKAKLLLLSSFLFVIPWFGYQYVWEMEKYLRFGQEQTIVGTARALATALHERANLFNNQASFLPSVEKGKDLYGYQFNEPIQLDGLKKDWVNYSDRAHYYDAQHRLNNTTQTSEVIASTVLPKSNPISVTFSASVAKYDKYLYLFFSVKDDHVIFRDTNALSVVNNDHIELAFDDNNNNFKRFIISNKSNGWLSAFHIANSVDNSAATITPAPKIQGQWLTTAQGYNIELRIPLDDIGDKIAFAVHDVDKKHGEITASIGSASPKQTTTLGTILVPSPEIERIVKGMRYSHSSIWVIDQHHRVLASAGSLLNAGGVWQKNSAINDNNHNDDGLWQTVQQKFLLPLYYKILTKPPSHFIDKLYDAQHLTGDHIITALTGQATSQWRLTTDKQALVLSAAYPIYIDNQVKGAVIVEETTNGIRTLRNLALEKLFSVILAIMILGALTFTLFATRISSRISRLSNQAEQAIDEHGRITGAVQAASTNDEIGDLSRSFARAVNRLSQYNHYLENMSARLSHELRTPIAVVKTSLEILALEQENNQNPQNSQNKHKNAYIERAQTGINTLNLILTNMSEATRLEQILVNTEKSSFNITQLIKGCISGYQGIYPEVKFTLINKTITNPEQKSDIEDITFYGSPEHIVQLLDKVINNAVEFSNDNNVLITLQQQSQQLHLTISNNGVHLPKAMLTSLFDSMVSVRSQSKQAQPHLGLGLYIARLICHFHQGDITAENHFEPDGVSINISLPLPK
ncbi:proteobacterial dedicated sortase system histidine kinase [Colwellia sp. D2M02]|uniref:proteobacterial dedicated sortase system histidine kinase n=1 Tax=Colwellia sp. D2M02 TaxID=2841562 RepID=UPI00339D7B03